MEIERRPISSIFGLAVTVRNPIPSKGFEERNAITRNEVFLVRKDNGKIIASVCRDDLFDKDGNRFYYDA